MVIFYSVVSLHIELDENMTLKESHKIVHRAQNNVLKKVPLVYAVFKTNNPIIRPMTGSIIEYPLFDAKTPTNIATDEKISTF